jgi:hypothetical protein
MEQGSRKGIRQTYAPNAFTMLLNPADYRELTPFLDTISSDVKGELQRVAEERNYLLAGELTITLAADADTPEGKPRVNGSMQGKAESTTTVMLSEMETGLHPSPEAVRDALTVILLPSDEPARHDPIEESICFLREGEVKAAADSLAKAGPDQKDTPRFLAAMAVAMEMLGQSKQAGRYYRRLQEVDGPRPGVQRRIEHLATFASMETGEPGRIELSGTGAAIRFRPDTVELDNPQQDARVQVNGVVQRRVRLKTGDTIRIGNLEMTCRTHDGINDGP